MGNIPWDQVWGSVAERLAGHREAGRGHLLTEESLRWETILALGRVDVLPGRLTTEVVVAALPGARIDLVIDGPGGTVIELKFPRGARVATSPQTQIFGQLLRDLFRVAAVPAADRWVVQVLDEAGRRAVDAAFDRVGVRWAWAPGQTVRLPPGSAARLAPTAGRALGTAAAAVREVVGTCAAAPPAGPGWNLYAYRIDGPAAAFAARSDVAAGPCDVRQRPTGPARVATRGGARDEILAAARMVMTRRGDGEFPLTEVVEEMQRQGTGYATSTIRTMIANHLCEQAGGTGDVVRLDRGRYRLA